MAFKLSVSAFGEGADISRKHTCDGADLSPALEWSGEPAGTRSFALIMDDPDAPAGTWTHWLLFDIPAEVKSLDESYKPGRVGVSGINDFGRPGYEGPRPPRGHGPHRYYLRLCALDVPSLRLASDARRANLDKALAGHVLDEAQYMGTYERK